MARLTKEESIAGSSLEAPREGSSQRDSWPTTALCSLGFGTHVRPSLGSELVGQVGLVGVHEGGVGDEDESATERRERSSGCRSNEGEDGSGAFVGCQRMTESGLLQRCSPA